jgi:16S rRNA (cytosine1402-N4)-methyltransferase
VSTTLIDMRPSDCGRERPSDHGRERDARTPELARRRRGAGSGARSGRDPREDGTARGESGVRVAHVPVLAGELLTLADLDRVPPPQLAIDCTFGDGGHARLVAERLGSSGTLIAIDRDSLAEERFAALAAETACSVRFIRSGYAEALELLADEGVRADVVYFDLGMSSMQVDTRERGFSYSYEAPLDMRMDPEQDLSAREIVAEWDERRLAHTLRDFGEERHAGAIARAIVRRREQAPIETTLELVETISSALPAPARFGGGHPAKRSFQALRIAVNDELGQLDRALPLAWKLLREGGVLAGISFQSLEDRRVKRFLGERAQGCVCPPEFPVCVCGREPEAALLRRRSIVPGAEELARNPRSASARLRAARKLREHGELGEHLPASGPKR